MCGSSVKMLRQHWGIATRMMRCLAMLTPKISIKGRGSSFPTPMERFNIQQLSTSLAYIVLSFPANFQRRNNSNGGLPKRSFLAFAKQEDTLQLPKPTLKPLEHWLTQRKKKNGWLLKTRK